MQNPKKPPAGSRLNSNLPLRPEDQRLLTSETEIVEQLARELRPALERAAEDGATLAAATVALLNLLAELMAHNLPEPRRAGYVRKVVVPVLNDSLRGLRGRGLKSPTLN